ncbi:HNH endonuclease [Micromonospora haikouensis]|uniref:HNH endonuclease n=1 Tax=Micromonospora haikouensis TaxID=686309 RepID=UPI0036A5694B
MREPTIKNCAACSAQFDDESPSRNRRFCSERCRRRSKERRHRGKPEADKPTLAACPVCATSLEGRHHGTVYCTDACYQRGRNRQRLGLPVADPPMRACARCGSPVIRQHWNQSRFCSRRCGSLWHLHARYYAARPKVERPCLVCGVVFVTAATNKIYCSKRCAGRNRSPEVVYRYVHARRVRLQEAEVLPVPAKVLRRLRAGSCTYCPQPAETIDHLVPLNRGGRHAEGNLVPACRSCNSSKGDKFLIEWLRWKSKQRVRP